jgi:LysM repeat protein
MMSRGLVLVVGGSCASLLLLSGCGKKVVSEKTVESQVASELAAQVHQPAPTVKCPGDLTAKVGATLKCTLTPKSSTTVYPVTVTVTSVTNGVAHFHAQVGSTPVSGG